MATLLGGDPDMLFRLAESTDPDLAEYIHQTPTVPEFLRVARALELTAGDFTVLTEQIKRSRPSETGTTGKEQGLARTHGTLAVCARLPPVAPLAFHLAQRAAMAPLAASVAPPGSPACCATRQFEPMKKT